MTLKKSKRRDKSTTKPKICQEGHANSNEDKELPLFELGQFHIEPAPFKWPRRRRSKPKPDPEQEDLFPMNFFGEVVDYDEQSETLAHGWGQCEDDEEDTGWLD